MCFYRAEGRRSKTLGSCVCSDVTSGQKPTTFSRQLSDTSNCRWTRLLRREERLLSCERQVYQDGVRPKGTKGLIDDTAEQRALQKQHEEFMAQTVRENMELRALIFEAREK